MKEGCLVLFVPESRTQGQMRWLRVIEVRPRTAKLEDSRLKVIEFDRRTGIAEGPYTRLGRAFSDVEGYRAFREREALERAVECALAKSGAVRNLSNETLREICAGLGVKSAPYSAAVPDYPEGMPEPKTVLEGRNEEGFFQKLHREFVEIDRKNGRRHLHIVKKEEG